MLSTAKPSPDRLGFVYHFISRGLEGKRISRIWDWATLLEYGKAGCLGVDIQRGETLGKKGRNIGFMSARVDVCFLCFGKKQMNIFARISDVSPA